MSHERTHKLTSIGLYDDDFGYDAVRNAKEKYHRDPEKYTTDRRHFSSHSTRHYGRNRGNERVHVVLEHWSGCTGERKVDDIKNAIEDYFPDVKVTEFFGRTDSFEVFINGKLLYSRIMQGGYPYEDEVLDGVWRAKHGKEIYQVDRYGGSGMCNIL